MHIYNTKVCDQHHWRDFGPLWVYTETEFFFEISGVKDTDGKQLLIDDFRDPADSARYQIWFVPVDPARGSFRGNVTTQGAYRSEFHVVFNNVEDAMIPVDIPANGGADFAVGKIEIRDGAVIIDSQELTWGTNRSKITSAEFSGRLDNQVSSPSPRHLEMRIKFTGCYPVLGAEISYGNAGLVSGKATFRLNGQFIANNPGISGELVFPLSEREMSDKKPDPTSIPTDIRVFEHVSGSAFGWSLGHIELSDSPVPSELSLGHTAPFFSVQIPYTGGHGVTRVDMLDGYTRTDLDPFTDRPHLGKGRIVTVEIPRDRVQAAALNNATHNKHAMFQVVLYSWYGNTTVVNLPMIPRLIIPHHR